jgi:hypothetical protein
LYKSTAGVSSLLRIVYKKSLYTAALYIMSPLMLLLHTEQSTSLQSELRSKDAVLSLQDASNNCSHFSFLTQLGVYLRFEVSTAVTVNNAVFWDTTSCGYCKN